MRKSVTILSLAAAATVLAAPCARAEVVSVKAAIPFDFVVADRQLPSGEYRFVRADAPGVVHVYAAGTREHLATVFCRALTRDPDAQAELAFDKHGSQRFLKTIRSGDGSGVYLPDTRKERRAEAQALAEARARVVAEALAAGGGGKGVSRQ
jgi:hypothetical protein